MSPEVVRKEGYNYLRDIFSLGVLAYELLHGNTPFFADDIKDIYHKIQNDKPEIKKPVSADCQQFILACLEKSMGKRLGAHSGMSEVLFHPWLRSVVYNINKENNKQNPFATFIPKKQILTSSSPSLNFLNEFYQTNDNQHRQAIPAIRYFDFSFRFSQDKPDEFADLEDGYQNLADTEYSNPGETSMGGSGTKIKMANNIKIKS